MEIRRLQDVDIGRLRVFMAVVESGGFAAAQAELGVSPATISVRMSELEYTLGVRLCNRGRGGFSMTDDGKSVYRECEQLFLAHERFRDSVRNMRGLLTGELKIGLIDNIIFDPLCPVPDALRHLCEASLDLELTVYTMEPLELQRAIIDRRVHLAIGVFYKKVESLKFTPLFKERMVMYCAPGNPLFDMDADQIGASDIQSQNCVERTYGQTTNNLRVPLELRAGAYSSSLESTAILILSGKYLGFLPDYYAESWIGRGMLKPVRPDSYFYESEICVVTRDDQHNNPLVRALSGILQNNV